MLQKVISVVVYRCHTGIWDHDPLCLFLISLSRLIHLTVCCRPRMLSDFYILLHFLLIGVATIWKPCIPPSHSFIFWRLMHYKLPTDENLKRRGCYIVSVCSLCMSQDKCSALVFWIPICGWHLELVEFEVAAPYQCSFSVLSSILCSGSLLFLGFRHFYCHHCSHFAFYFDDAKCV